MLKPPIWIVLFILILVALDCALMAPADAAKPDPLVARVAALDAQVSTLTAQVSTLTTQLQQTHVQLDASFEEVYDHLNYLKLHVELLEHQGPTVLHREAGPQEARQKVSPE